MSPPVFRRDHMLTGLVSTSPPKGYIEQLERRVNTLERLLTSLAPSVNAPKASGDANTWNGDPTLESSTKPYEAALPRARSMSRPLSNQKPTEAEDGSVYGASDSHSGSRCCASPSDNDGQGMDDRFLMCAFSRSF